MAINTYQSENLYFFSMYDASLLETQGRRNDKNSVFLLKQIYKTDAYVSSKRTGVTLEAYRDTQCIRLTSHEKYFRISYPATDAEHGFRLRPGAARESDGYVVPLLCIF